MLCEVVRHEAELRKPAGKDGRETVRDHIAAAVRIGRLPASALEGPETGPELEYLLEWFRELERTRTYSGMNSVPDPLTYPTIQAWAHLTGRSPSPLEVEGLLTLDLVSRFPDRPKEHDHG